MKTFTALCLMSAGLLTLAACAQTASPTDKAPGTYTSSSTSTNASGTKSTTEQKTHVYRDSSGNKKAVVETEKTSDPKGLFNKRTSTTTKSYQ